MQNTYLEELTQVLQTDERLVNADGKLLKTKIGEYARRLDDDLVKLLLANSKLKGFFFKDIDGTLAFDLNKFLNFIHNEAFLADSYTAFKNKIGLATSKDDYLSENSDVVLNWPYKDCVLEGGQDKEDQKRDEVFWNETLGADQRDVLLAPKVLTGFRRYDKHGEHEVVELNESDNFIIKGNNLLALHTLKKRYAGKVKLIYIDPPYNTGGDSFGYNDSFNKATWLTFMKNRLVVAKQLLSDNGVIYISIDHHENHTLKLLMDEVFGRSNSIQDIIVETSSPAGFKLVNPGPVKVTETILVYAKNKSLYINDEKKLFVEDKWPANYDKYIENYSDEVSSWRIAPLSKLIYKQLDVESQKELKEKFGQSADAVYSATASALALQNSEAVFTTYKPHNPAPQLKKAVEESKITDKPIAVQKSDGTRHILLKGRLMAFYQSKLKKIDERNPVPTRHLTNLWTDLSWSGIGSEGGNMLNNGKKPEKLLERILNLSTNPGDLVLDYHLGSGTTAAVAHKMGRQYIGIEQLYYGNNDPTNRLQNVINGDQSGISKSVNWQGGGSFVYAHLKNDVNAFIKKVEKAKDSAEIEDLLQTVLTSNFLSHRVDPRKFEKETFGKLALDAQKHLLIDLVNKNKLYVNYHDMDDESYNVDENTKKLNHWLQSRN